MGILLASLISLISNTSTFAVWNGTQALGDKRAVPVILFPNSSCGGSGFLYSSRIVFTAGHSIFEGDDRQKAHTPELIRKAMWVGYPGSKLDRTSRRVEVEKIFYPSNYESRDAWLGGNRITRNNDFAVLVLKTPLPVDDKKVELLTAALHDEFINSGEIVSMVGYGAQSASDIGNCRTETIPMKFESQVIGKTVNVGSQVWTAPLNFKNGVRKPSACDGDSGSGYFKELSDKYIYLGAAGAGAKDFHNCESNGPALDKEGIMGAWPVYLYTDLVKQAEEYVVANPYVAPVVKKSIKCVKGKKSIKVRNENPTCPKGYKQK